MPTPLPTTWSAWRAEPPLAGRRPTKADMAAAIDSGLGREDVLPYPSDEQSAGMLRMLIVGINPSPWTASVNAPFARPGNRFWPSLAAAGILPHVVDASTGLSREDERLLAQLGIGITNFVSRPSARADELTVDELHDGGQRLVQRVQVLQPRAVAVVGITAFRTAFGLPKAKLGPQDVETIAGWPSAVQLWGLPNPSGLNAHETIESLAQKWRAVWDATAEK
ncbi:MAG TPA: mismatch-specific DNA-glycosylase [Yaniella sp.]